MNLQTSRQQLAELLDEQRTRQQTVADAQARRQGAVQRLSELRAQMALDGVDLTARIAQCEKEIAGAEAVIALWPDVQAELARRQATAEQALKDAQIADLLGELDTLNAAEPGARLAFAQALLQLAQVGQALNTTLQRKLVLKAELSRLGRPVTVGDTEMPMFNRWGIGQAALVDEALALVARCK